MEGYVHGLRDKLPPVNILDWGERGTMEGIPVNLQPDGSSAIWVKAENLNPLDIQNIFFGSIPCRMRPTVCKDFFTIDVPDSVINKSGEYKITIEEGIGRRTQVGFFRVTE